MKIGILTLVGNNYGNRLQNYALQEYLKSLNADIKVFTFQRNYSKNVALAKVKHLIKMFTNPDDIFIKEIKSKFKNFNDKHITFAEETVYKSRSNRLLNYKYDMFIVGSDQVWNPGYPLTSAVDFISFADKRKRISYAASMGMSELPNEKEKQFKQWFNEMYSISVREKSSADLIKKLCSKEAQVHIDPTMLLTLEQWEKIEKKPEWYDGSKYVLAYFLGEQYSEVKYKLKEARKEFNVQVIHVFSKEQGLNYIHDPAEFLWLVHHAEKVLTDSFHCVVFSILFNKKFSVFRRAGNESNTGSRLDNLLSMFSMPMFNGCYVEVSNYSREVVQDILEKERERSKNYLMSNLELNS